MCRTSFRAVLLGGALLALTACDEPFDFDLRDLANSDADTSEAARQSSASRPPADDRGIISYPNYQVAVAERGDTVADVADRIGVSAVELANFNGMQANDRLRPEEVLVLPRRVTEPSPATGSVITGPITPESVDVTTLAGNAIDSAQSRGGPIITPASELPETGIEPIRHQVERGETAFSISRLYNVSVNSLAEWNGLGSDLGIREGQYLLIPVAAPVGIARGTARPGVGSQTPTPPSAAQPLPAQNTQAASAKPNTPPSPNLGQQRTAASDSNARMVYPVTGNIIRAYRKGSNDGIDIAARAGTPVKAAAAGTVAAITRDTNQVPIIVIRHSGDILTVYARVDNLKVSKGDRVQRGQTIAEVRNSDPSFLHFEVREGLDSVDPTRYLQ
ncbi:peptidoglycan DD-metalloendopeptidase family protein [Sulfitobacter sp. 1151]|uniref:Peptidoglycan DD-metalloendopeptidase family protein n=1 Tax=Parasulfitobacter algicola TaxID=2614809 RepID=A0ABX2ITH1_9RHOB|nr:peptidoglycan DD-metalloendopeptidase family protein [Sulfitobacter algicola]NSX55845.1 peptidoglycan DD-metalloendopeptidase family protein [Sulfitobacter algicola]